MKLKFNGIVGRQSGGCRPCGTRRAGHSVLQTKKTFILPSGKNRTFYAGRITEVTEDEGRFLLSFNDEHQMVFTEVE